MPGGIYIDRESGVDGGFKVKLEEWQKDPLNQVKRKRLNRAINTALREGFGLEIKVPKSAMFDEDGSSSQAVSREAVLDFGHINGRRDISFVIPSKISRRSASDQGITVKVKEYYGNPALQLISRGKVFGVFYPRQIISIEQN